MEIDSVLNYLLQKAREELGEVKVKVNLPEKMKHFFEMNVLIGNLLENAIEAAEETEEKYLNVSVVFEKEVLRILVENSFLSAEWKDKKYEQEGKNLPVSKKHREHHGIGLKNVKKIVESHNGIMEINTEGDRFRVEIMLYMEGQGGCFPIMTNL